MTPTVHVCLFSSSPAELGWTGNDLSTVDVGHLSRLADAMMWDLAVRCAAVQRFRVSVYLTEQSGIEPSGATERGLVIKRHPDVPLHNRIMDGVRRIYQASPSAHVAVIIGRNPLYRVDLLSRGVALLGQEEDLVVFDEGSDDATNRTHCPLMWLAMNSYQSELFEGPTHWWRGGDELYSHLWRCRGLYVPVHGDEMVCSWDDMRRLFHEMQRQVLLKRWYPRHTYEVLSRFEGRGILQEGRL